MFYNEERKREYFNYVNRVNPDASKPIIYLFKYAAPIEEAWGKDLCDFTLTEIEKVMSTFGAPTKFALAKNLSIYKSYTTWCCNNKLSIDNINHYEELGMDDLEPYVNSVKDRIFSEKDINLVLNKLINDSDRFLVLALFEGVRPANCGELLLISLNDIDKDTKIVTFPSGTKKKMSSRLYELAVQSSSEEVYYSYKDGQETFASALQDNGMIVKPRTNSRNNDIPHVNKRINDKFVTLRRTYNEPDLVYSKLRISGIICQLKKIMDYYNIDRDTLFNDSEYYNTCINMASLSNYELYDIPKSSVKTKVYRFL